MIRSYFGLDQNPFSGETPALLPQQREVFETLRVHCQQGGLCLVVGEPGTGKSVIKQALCRHDSKRMLTPVINRTLHTYHSTLRILCEAFQIDTPKASTSSVSAASSKRLSVSITRAKRWYPSSTTPT